MNCNSSLPTESVVFFRSEGNVSKVTLRSIYLLCKESDFGFNFQ